MTRFEPQGRRVAVPSAHANGHPFAVAVVSASDVAARSLGSVLECSGYAVRLVDVSREATTLSAVTGADAVIIVAPSARHPSVDLCLRLHGDAALDPTTPILVVVSSDCTRNERLEILGAGAWETSSEPLDGEMLLLKLQRFMRMRRAVDRVQARQLVEESTGLYRWGGLVRRSQELVALSTRRRAPICMLALDLRETPMDSVAGAPPDGVRVAEREAVGRVWRESLRATDAVGRVGESTYLCIAPDSDAEGARAILRRTRRLLSSTISSDGLGLGERLRAGYCAVAEGSSSPVSGVELLERAMLRSGEAALGETVGEML